MNQQPNPTAVIGIPAYFQGRPNTMFLGRYGTLDERVVRTAA